MRGHPYSNEENAPPVVKRLEPTPTKSGKVTIIAKRKDDDLDKLHEEKGSECRRVLEQFYSLLILF